MKKKIIAFLCIMIIMVPYITMFAMPVSAAGENNPSIGVTYGANNSLVARLGFDPGAFFNDMLWSVANGQQGVDYWASYPGDTQAQYLGFKIRWQTKYQVGDFYGSSLHNHYYKWFEYSSLPPTGMWNITDDSLYLPNYDRPNSTSTYFTGRNNMDWTFVLPYAYWAPSNKPYWQSRFPHESEYWEYIYQAMYEWITYMDYDSYNAPGLMTYLSWLEQYYPGYYFESKITIHERTWWDSLLNKIDQLKTAVANSPVGSVYSFLTGSAQSFFDSAISKLNSIFTAIQNSPVGSLFTWLNTTLWSTIDSISTAVINFPTTLNNLWTDIKNIGSTISTAIFSPLWDFIFPSQQTVASHVATRMNEFKNAENSILIIPFRFFGDLINFTEEIQADNGLDVGGGVAGGGAGGGGGGVWGGEGAPDNPGQYVITVPPVSIPIKGTTHQLWSGFSFDLAVIDTYYGFAWLNNFCRILISGALIFGLIFHIYRKLYSALAGGLVE